MADITDKSTVALPVSVEERCGRPAGDAPAEALDVQARLRLFDAATEWQRARESTRKSTRELNRAGRAAVEQVPERGRTRDDLH